MEPKTCFDEIKEYSDKFAKDEVASPMYKVENRVVEGQRLYGIVHGKRSEFEKLAGVGLFNMFNINSLETVALALRYVESGWILMRNPTRDEAFRAKLELIEKMRTGFIRDLAYIDSRFSPEGLKKSLGIVREGSSRQDMLQDVETLATLCRKYQGQLEKIGFEPGMIDQASALATELGRVLNVDKSDMELAKENRDRVSTLLEKMMFEVRSAAEFLFRHDSDVSADFGDQGR